MRFVAGYTLPAPIPVNKDIRKATFDGGLPAISPRNGQPADICEIAVYAGMHVRQLGVSTATLLRGARQHRSAGDECTFGVSLFKLISQNAAQRDCVVLLHNPHPRAFDLNQRRFILRLSSWANRAMSQRTTEQEQPDDFHGGSSPRLSQATTSLMRGRWVVVGKW